LACLIIGQSSKNMGHLADRWASMGAINSCMSGNLRHAWLLGSTSAMAFMRRPTTNQSLESRARGWTENSAKQVFLGPKNKGALHKCAHGWPIFSSVQDRLDRLLKLAACGRNGDGPKTTLTRQCHNGGPKACLAWYENTISAACVFFP
jgi:hypothetical protein